MFNLYINNNYYYNRFKKLITVTFKKVIKKNYNQLKIYKLIVLLNTLRKVFKLIIVRQLSYFVEIIDLSFKTYINNRRIIFIKHVIYLILKKIYLV